MSKGMQRLASSQRQRRQCLPTKQYQVLWLLGHRSELTLACNVQIGLLKPVNKMVKCN